MNRVAITGMGIVAPGAIGVEAFRQQLAAGGRAVVEIDRFDTAGLRSHRAALIRDFKARDFIAPMKLRRMNLLSRYALAAAKLAFDDRGGERLSGEVGVVLGTAFGPVQTSVDYMREYVEKGAALAPPQLFAESVANAPGSHIAIESDLRGFNITITQRESSALAAAMYGAAQLLKGVTRAAVIGGVDEVNEIMFSVLDRVGALARASGELEEAARPFDRRRNGLTIGEGSVILIAEPPSTNTPKTYAYLSGFGIARDTSASVSDWGSDAASVVTAMRAAIDDAGLTPADIDAIYASANGNVRGDRVEARGIIGLFGHEGPPVVATKGAFGEYTAGGALQLVCAILAVHDQLLQATCGFEEMEQDMRLDIVTESRPASLRHVLVNALSAGGGIVSTVVSRSAT